MYRTMCKMYMHVPFKATLPKQIAHHGCEEACMGTKFAVHRNIQNQHNAIACRIAPKWLVPRLVCDRYIVQGEVGVIRGNASAGWHGHTDFGSRSAASKKSHICTVKQFLSTHCRQGASKLLVGSLCTDIEVQQNRCLLSETWLGKGKVQMQNGHISTSINTNNLPAHNPPPYLIFPVSFSSNSSCRRCDFPSSSRPLCMSSFSSFTSSFTSLRTSSTFP